jgi:hypothetical protein
MEKCPIPKFVFNPFWTGPVWGTIVPQGGLGLKNYKYKMFLEFNFREGLFYVKNLIQNFQRTPILEGS